MAESELHVYLVEQLVDWVSAEYFSGDKGSILADNKTSGPQNTIPFINGYRPDVFVNASHLGFCIIGEAEPPKALESKHTRKQLKALLEHCNKLNNGVFVLAVPWYSSCQAFNLVLNIKRNNSLMSVNSIVLKNLSGL